MPAVRMGTDYISISGAPGQTLDDSSAMKRRFTTADLGLTDAQHELMRKHGTPGQFAAGCYECVPALISMDEAKAAIDKYNRDWGMAGPAKEVE